MNFRSKWLALPSVWLTAASLSAAPIPPRGPVSQGPISDALTLRDRIPMTAAPQVKKVAMTDDATVEVQHRVMQAVATQETVNQTQYVIEQRETIVKKDGKDVKVVTSVYVPVTRQATVTKMVMVPTNQVRKESVSAKECKFFAVTRDGKLETLEAKQAAARLKGPTMVLTGERTDLDPHHLELVRPGTLYVVLPPVKREVIAPPRIEKSRD